ncbi:MAG: c-type cytochrome [Balneolaceae bacterium]
MTTQHYRVNPSDPFSGRDLPASIPGTLLPVICAFILFCFPGCGEPQGSGMLPAADGDNGGLLLPDGFEAVVVADSIGSARHIVVNENGDIYVKLRRSTEDGSMVALRDTTGDGKADIIENFGFYDNRGSYETDIDIRNGYLYFSTNLEVLRIRMNPGELVPSSPPDTIVADNHEHGTHAHQTKPFSFDNAGNMYVPFGAPSDTCQDPSRTPGLAGQDPCPELEDHGGVWAFDPDRKNQTQAEGSFYATGVRSVVAMDWNPVDEELYLVNHGRDFMFRQWTDIYSRWESALLPAEEFVRMTEGSNFGWPYCYYDQMQNRKVLNPEYGGDGSAVGRCSEYDDPLIGFPGHFAPNDLMFYRGVQFPEHYTNGAFITFHGSTIRNPYPQGGYFVAFVPFENGVYSDDWEVFANGFAEVDPIVNTRDAEHRPMGLATGPDGSLYITDSVVGKIWRIMYTGDKTRFGEDQLARMVEEKQTASNIRTPREPEDNLEMGMTLEGELVYNTYCAACHQRDGEGAPPRFPGITGSEWITGDKQLTVNLILNGLDTPRYEITMPAHAFLRDEEIAEIATYIRQNFGDNGSGVSSEEVREIRNRANSD